MPPTDSFVIKFFRGMAANLKFTLFYSHLSEHPNSTGAAASILIFNFFGVLTKHDRTHSQVCGKHLLPVIVKPSLSRLQ